MDRFRWLEFGDAPPSSPADARDGAPGPDGRTLLDRAEDLFLNGRYEPALREFSRALAEDRHLDEAWAGQVRCHLAMRELAQARVWANKALEMRPRSPRVLSAAALVAARQGQGDEALRLSDLALELGRGMACPFLWLERAECLLRAGARQPAGDCLERVADLAGSDPDLAQRVGLTLLEAGAPELAWPQFQSALERRPERAWLWLLSARAARALQLEDRAVQALALDPGMEEARTERMRLKTGPGRTWLGRLLGWQDS